MGPAALDAFTPREVPALRTRVVRTY
jgi:hypothetical protein